MKRTLLKESPDTLRGLDGKWYDVYGEGNITFICDGVGGYAFADTMPHGRDQSITHPDLVKNTLRVFKGLESLNDESITDPNDEYITDKILRFRKESWARNYGLVELQDKNVSDFDKKAKWALINRQLIFNSREMDMLSFSGRYYKEPHILTFWQPSTEMTNKYPVLEPMVKAMGIDLENLQMEFVDYPRWYIPYGSPVKNVGKNKEAPDKAVKKRRSEKEIRELQQAQHLDPDALKKLRASDEVFTPEPKIKDPLRNNYYSRFSEGSEFNDVSRRILEL